MKLAVIMSGMLRNYEHTIFSTKKFLFNDEFFELKDIFFCGYSDNQKLKNAQVKFQELYSPKGFKLENWSDELKKSIELNTGCDKWDKLKNHKANLTNVMSSWRCRYLANQLRIKYEKENNIKYDIIYNLRSDLFFFNKIDHNLALKASKDYKSVFVPRDWDFKSANKIAIGDIMAIGSPQAMTKYYSLYKHANDYRKKRVPGHPETILGYHFKFQKIKRRYCLRNLAREYPYSIPETNYLWKKNWPVQELLKEVKNNEDLLSIFKSIIKKNYQVKNKGKIINFFNFIKKSINYMKKIFIDSVIRFFILFRN